jgi:hypothetical protein
MKVCDRDSCRPLFKALFILPFYSQYIFSISSFVVKNVDKFVTNSDIHSIHTRQGLDLHYPTCKLTKVQKGVSFTGIRIFNNHLVSKTCQRILINSNIPLKMSAGGLFLFFRQMLWVESKGWLCFLQINNAPVISQIFNVILSVLLIAVLDVTWFLS